MLIKRIRLDGYKNIDDVNIELGQVTALIGLNNYGKTNILTGIDYANKFIKATPDLKYNMMNYTSAIPINKATASKNFNFEIEYYTKLDNKEVLVEYGFEFNWPKNGEEYNQEDEKNKTKILKEFLRIKENQKNQKYNIYINRTNGKNLYKSAETGRCDKNINIEDDYLILNKLNNYDDLYYINVIRELNNLNFEVDSFLDTGSAFRMSPIRFKNNNKYKLEKDGSNIEEIIYNLQEEENELYELLKDCFFNLFPNIEGLEPLKRSIKINSESSVEIPDDAPFMIRDDIYRIKVKEKHNNQYMNFENLSDGTKRVFLFLTSIILADKNKNPLIAFEELENCIHPALFKLLIESIKMMTEYNDSRVIISSHSPILIRHIDLDDIYIGVPNDDGVAKFKKIKKSKRKLIRSNSNEQNITEGNYIFELLSKNFSNDKDDTIISMMEME